MKFLDALANPYFWWYTGPAAVLLALAWAALFRLQRRGWKVGPLWRIFWAWLLLAAVAVAGALLGHEGFVFLVVLVALFACREFVRGTGLHEDWLFTALVYFAILAVNGVALGSGNPGLRYDVFMATPIYAVAGLCILPVLRNRSEGMLQRVALAVMAFVYFGYFLAHLSMLTSLYEGPEVVGYLFFLLFGSGLTGLAAELVDRWHGRHPIAPRISTEKTWEGAAAGLALALLWSFSVGWSLSAFTWPALLVCAVLFGVMGVLGELVMRYVLHDLRLHEGGGASAVDPALALNHVNRLIFVAPLFFRLVHFLTGLDGPALPLLPPGP